MISIRNLALKGRTGKSRVQEEVATGLEGMRAGIDNVNFKTFPIILERLRKWNFSPACLGIDIQKRNSGNVHSWRASEKA
jgi:hypothetical protein